MDRAAKTRAKARAKMHIYAHLAQTLALDADDGLNYLRALVEGVEEVRSGDDRASLKGYYDGPRLPEPVVRRLVDTVVRELRKRSRPRPTVRALRGGSS